MQIRLATERDIDQLIRMRYDFTLEYAPEINADYEIFYLECKTFLEKAITGARWFIWVAEVDEKVVSHIYIQLIDKVPRPGRITYPFGYVTNVYTLPLFRSKGIGSQIIKSVERWAKEGNLEFLIVWPSMEGVPFYERNGYANAAEAMELHL
ncbi:GNAT family N-acetyltransferase [Paenibacillus psychroresistens]|uniref:GNAT family N-acetyltransferase n=1 Tax=Paenibacillus psychroresistens TaxID=1778678 RepID=A0A6B8REM8_9BACL|nr:GNAT family N-acetyltransferase [Paenibacillus psychroresistens]QGQ93816.1 GNAT family N-acetyltransferase [Paenibacillus psychroresistens]